MMINQYIKQSGHQGEDSLVYIIIGFKKTIIVIEKSLFSKLQPLLFSNSSIKICFLSEINDININFTDESQIIDSNDRFFKEEIDNFNQELFHINLCDTELKKIWYYILPCITSYLIKEAYEKTNINRLNNFINFEKMGESTSTQKNVSIPIINEDEFINLRQIGVGSAFMVELIYHIERKELYAQKKQLRIDNEIEKLRDREIENYKKIQHPFIPKLIGMDKNKKYLIIEFVNGQTLTNINKFQLTFSDKITIFFEMMIIIEYLHRKQFIYRDLKPNNVMIDKNKTVVLIDFDRMIKYEDSLNTTTKDFFSLYCAPEVNKTNFSYECDIYSLAYSFLYMMNQSLDDFLNSNESEEIKQIITQCTNEEPNKRPSIINIIFTFYTEYHKNIQIYNLFEIYLINFTEFYRFAETDEDKRNFLFAQFCIELLYGKSEFISSIINKFIHFYSLVVNQNDAEAQFYLGYLYEEGGIIPCDMNKSIHYYTLAAKQNFAKAQYNLGVLYKNGELIPRDMNKSIYYFSLAANQNNAEAQFALGLLYQKGDLIPRDMNKSIYYYSLAANQNFAKAQYNLGVLYEKGELIPRDMNKSIHYYSLAANQNNVMAQNNLGYLYGKGDLISRDMNKSIYYYSLAANQNFARAQFNLGSLYEKGDLIPLDINKSIHYYSLAANQNNVMAQCCLGYIYGVSGLIPRDMNKYIYYYSLAANQNDVEAQLYLGSLYERGDLIPRDMNKSIYYYSLAANQNNAGAQYNLGVLYGKGELIPRDMNKSIYYYSLAANQNNAEAQLYLGLLYEKGELIPRNMNKSIYYYSLAANQNNTKAQFNLGLLYQKGDLIPRDMNKSIYYYSLAANQNNAEAQFNLGYLYQEGDLIPRDMNKSIHYYSLAAKQNDARAQFNLGYLYWENNLIPRDIDKSIYYYSLAAKQNDARAQCNLGYLYWENNLIPRDIDKSIYYYSLAANQNNAKAQFALGLLYEKGDLIPRDMNKSIYYYSLAANNNFAEAQFCLAIIYISHKNIKKAIEYLTFSANQNFINSLFTLALFNLKGLYIKKDLEKGVEYLIKCTNCESKLSIYANFIIGYFYHIGLYVQQDIKKAIKYYKEASSFNYLPAKNNLGIIYKNGFENEIKKELGWAIEYFKESIKKVDNYIPMYNLAHLYFYENVIENGNLESIKLLIASSNQDHYPSKFLLCIVSIYEFGININNIIQELNKIEPISCQLIDSIYNIIHSNRLDQESILKEKYDQYRNIDYVLDFDSFYSYYSQGIDYLENGVQIKEEKNIRENINSEFYEGFGM